MPIERRHTHSKRTKQVYMLAENGCYRQFIREWKEWIEAGRLGDIFYAESEYIHNIQELLWDEESGEAFWRLERPPIYYCSHRLGPLLMLMEDRIVKATGAHSGYGIMPNKGIGCLNMEVGLFKTQKGAVIKLLRSQVALREPPNHFYSLYGAKGAIESGRTDRDRSGLLYTEEDCGSFDTYWMNYRYAGERLDPAADRRDQGDGHDGAGDLRPRGGDERGWQVGRRAAARVVADPHQYEWRVK